MKSVKSKEIVYLAAGGNRAEAPCIELFCSTYSDRSAMPRVIVSPDMFTSGDSGHALHVDQLSVTAAVAV